MAWRGSLQRLHVPGCWVAGCCFDPHNVFRVFFFLSIPHTFEKIRTHRHLCIKKHVHQVPMFHQQFQRFSQFRIKLFRSPRFTVSPTHITSLKLRPGATPTGSLRGELQGLLTARPFSWQNLLIYYARINFSMISYEVQGKHTVIFSAHSNTCLFFWGRVEMFRNFRRSVYLCLQQFIWEMKLFSFDPDEGHADRGSRKFKSMACATSINPIKVPWKKNPENPLTFLTERDLLSFSALCALSRLPYMTDLDFTWNKSAQNRCRRAVQNNRPNWPNITGITRPRWPPDWAPGCQTRRREGTPSPPEIRTDLKGWSLCFQFCVSATWKLQILRNLSMQMMRISVKGFHFWDTSNQVTITTWKIFRSQRVTSHRPHQGPSGDFPMEPLRWATSPRGHRSMAMETGKPTHPNRENPTKCWCKVLRIGHFVCIELHWLDLPNMADFTTESFGQNDKKGWINLGTIMITIVLLQKSCKFTHKTKPNICSPFIFHPLIFAQPHLHILALA